MNYQSNKLYQLLIQLGCEDSTGPIQKKKNIVQITLPDSGAQYKSYYHFDPEYKMNNKTYAVASKKQASTSTIFLVKNSGSLEDNYDLALIYFVFHLFGCRNIQNGVEIKDIVKKNKLKIFSIVFGVER